MERKFQLTYNGQEVETADLNLVASEAALADDRIFAELFRMTPRVSPADTAKGVLPYSSGSIIASDGATGKARVYPFRAFVASPEYAADSPDNNWRDIRSVSYVGGTDSLYSTVEFSDGDATDSRWDLVYLEIQREPPESTAVRYIKSPASPSIVSPTTIILTTLTNFEINVAEGTPSGSVVRPTLPSDVDGETFYIPLAYVRIGAGFDSSADTIAPSDIFDAAPVMRLNGISTGTSVVGPATSMFDPAGAMMAETDTGSVEWGVTGTRPPAFMPPSMSGEEVLYVALNLPGAAATTNWSQADASVIDSRDWRNRIFTWSAYVHTSASTFDEFPWEQSAVLGATVTAHTGSASVTTVTGSSITYKVNSGMGNSFVETSGGKRSIAYLDEGGFSTLSGGKFINFYVDSSDGKIKFTTGGTFPDASIFMRLGASAEYPNK